MAQAPAPALTIVNPALQQYEDGPPLAADYRFIPGETVFFSILVQGYQASSEQQVRLSCRVDATDADGARLVETYTDTLASSVSEMDKNWRPKFRHSFLIPPHALSGQFRVSARVKDEIGGREAGAEVAFQVHGRAVEKSDRLMVRNFHFYRTQDAAEPLTPAAYRSGDTLWARFDVTGFKPGEKNRIQVVYGISILSPSGKEMLSVPQAAVEKQSPFYPKRYFPGIFSLNVQPKTTPGEYTLVVTVRDEVGNQTGESRQTFRVE
jgi:hypothetical protein